MTNMCKYRIWLYFSITGFLQVCRHLILLLDVLECSAECFPGVEQVLQVLGLHLEHVLHHAADDLPVAGPEQGAQVDDLGQVEDELVVDQVAVKLGGKEVRGRLLVGTQAEEY